jgi:hypothetical protein
MSVDWPSVETIPTIVSSSDLFDGELFGDELIDIYNSSVGDGTSDDSNGKCLTLVRFRFRISVTNDVSTMAALLFLLTMHVCFFRVAAPSCALPGR